MGNPNNNNNSPDNNNVTNITDHNIDSDASGLSEAMPAGSSEATLTTTTTVAAITLTADGTTTLMQVSCQKHKHHNSENNWFAILHFLLHWQNDKAKFKKGMLKKACQSY